MLKYAARYTVDAGSESANRIPANGGQSMLFHLRAMGPQITGARSSSVCLFTPAVLLPRDPIGQVEVSSDAMFAVMGEGRMT